MHVQGASTPREVLPKTYDGLHGDWHHSKGISFSGFRYMKGLENVSFWSVKRPKGLKKNVFHGFEKSKKMLFSLYIHIKTVLLQLLFYSSTTLLLFFRPATKLRAASCTHKTVCPYILEQEKLFLWLPPQELTDLEIFAPSNTRISFKIPKCDMS